MQLTTNFSLEEMVHSQVADRNGLDNTPKETVVVALKKTASLLERVRSLLCTPIVISSGYRSIVVNAAVGGAASSQHTKGEAVDFTSPRYGQPSLIMRKIANSGIPFDQCILEYAENGGGWIHISCTDKPRNQMLIIDSKGARVYK